MSEQPKALRIAEWFEGGYGGCESEAATELRRLHEVNQELLETLREIEKLPGISSANLYARAAIAKGEQA
jgi:hypothetical protein